MYNTEIYAYTYNIYICIYIVKYDLSFMIIYSVIGWVLRYYYKQYINLFYYYVLIKYHRKCFSRV